MVHVFQVECWEKYPSGLRLLFIMAKGEIGKDIRKGFENEKMHIGNFIYEIN